MTTVVSYMENNLINSISSVAYHAKLPHHNPTTKSSFQENEENIDEQGKEHAQWC
jgi:hypothetical protein